MQLQQQAALLISAMSPAVALQELIILQDALHGWSPAMQHRTLALWVQQHSRYEVDSAKSECPMCAGVG